MSVHTDQHWGTKAILEAPIRDRGNTLICEINPEPDHAAGRPLRLVLNKESGAFWLNGHPFGLPSACLSVLARKLYLMETQARRTV